MAPHLAPLLAVRCAQEIFARQHNCQPGWVGLGNQLEDSNIKDPDLLDRYSEVYGEGKKDPMRP